ncbi:MAG: hypothetical protein WEB04_07575 [Dehalococcoidia bacterium]
MDASTKLTSVDVAILSQNDVIYYNFGIGAFPSHSFGSLTLTADGLSFRPRGLGWQPSWGRVPIGRIVGAKAKEHGSAVRRRLMWIASAFVVPIFGIFGLSLLPSFWPRAGGSTLEVEVKRWRLRRSRVYMLDQPEQWAAAINGLLEQAASDS